VSARRFVVGVSGSAGSLQALRYAAQLARNDGAVLAPVLAWTPPGGELADRSYPSPELRRVWKKAAWDRLWRAVELALGGPPADLEFSPKVIRGEAGPVLTEVAGQPGDVLVIGAGRHGSVRRAVWCRVSRYCLGHACCPVVAVPPSPLAEELRGLHGWVVRHRLHPENAGVPAAGG
jgi:nucleotide-binding universal stress UspA family protein